MQTNLDLYVLNDGTNFEARNRFRKTRNQKSYYFCTNKTNPDTNFLSVHYSEPTESSLAKSMEVGVLVQNKYGFWFVVFLKGF